MFPPIEAMFRSWAEAPSSRACAMTGNRWRTAGTCATSLIRASAPMRRPPPGRSSTRFSGRSLMSTSSVGRSTFWRTRSTSVVPPARNAPSRLRVTVAMALSTSATLA